MSDVGGGRPCRACGKLLVFVKSKATGAMMPLEAEVMSVVTDGGEVVRGRMSHFARCPKAGEFRKPRG